MAAAAKRTAGADAVADADADTDAIDDAVDDADVDAGDSALRDERVGIAALKYHDLKHERTRDYRFDLAQMLVSADAPASRPPQIDRARARARRCAATPQCICCECGGVARRGVA